MDRLEGIKIFVRVVESGSFSAVARELGTGQPAISKHVAALEERLGAQLLMRTSRSLSLTEAGRDFYESAVPLISDLEAAESRIGSGQASPSGVVRVTAAPGFSHRYVVPKLPSFRARYSQNPVPSLTPVDPLFWDVHLKFRCVFMRRSDREGRAFTHCSQRRPLRPFARAALPISAKR